MTPERSSSILFQNEINSKTIFLRLTQSRINRRECRPRNEFLNLYDILLAYKSRDCISPNMSAICWNLEVLHCAATAQWKHNFYVMLGKSALLRHVGKKVHQWCISPESFWLSFPYDTSEKPLFSCLRNVGK